MNLAHIVELAREARHIMDSTADPEVKYDLIFSKNISQEVKRQGVYLDYYDPDTSFEEDAEAYTQALEEYVGKFGNLV